eukprot:TRINITY_DN6048_c0_g1_i1.p1 TRINITY_DN6048_c0_g1~~TRINITY_DN6048_c0_g1_i1.p1  ORF type:complete len:199 (-),score=94.41 TRINITY_DN6048_c0_g1_i1:157-753(-)
MSRQLLQKTSYSLLRKSLRLSEFMTHHFALEISAKRIREVIKNSYRRNKNVTDYVTLQRLVFQFGQDVEEIVNVWMQKPHLISIILNEEEIQQAHDYKNIINQNEPFHPFNFFKEVTVTNEYDAEAYRELFEGFDKTLLQKLEFNQEYVEDPEEYDIEVMRRSPDPIPEQIDPNYIQNLPIEHFFTDKENEEGDDYQY